MDAISKREESRRSALQARDFAHRQRLSRTGSQFAYKIIPAKINLLLQTLPQAWQADAGADKIAVGLACSEALLPELSQQPVGFQPVRCSSRTKHRRIGTPAPLSRIAHHASAHWIEHHITGQLNSLGSAHLRGSIVTVTECKT